MPMKKRKKKQYENIGEKDKCGNNPSSFTHPKKR
jgi:hypothetical protein